MKTKRLPKLLAIALMLAMMLGLFAGCGSSSNESSTSEVEETSTSSEETGTEAEETESSTVATSQSDKTVTIAVGNDPVNLTPYGGGGEQRNIIVELLYEGLGFVNVDNEIDLILAKEMNSLGDGVYEFVLYDNIYDTAGNHMTASDVIFSLDQAGVTGNYTTAVSYLTDYEATDEYTVQLTIGDEKLGMLEAVVGIPLVTEAGWEQSGDEMALNPIGTSPYALASYESGSYYQFDRIDNYWQTDENLITVHQMSNPASVVISVITDKSTTAVALENGEIDMANSLNYLDYQNFIDDEGNAYDGYTVYIKNNNTLNYFIFNCSDDSPCSDINLRKAICYAIDTDAITYSVYGTFATTASNFANAAWFDPADDLDDYFNYDVDAAKEYLEQSSYAGETLSILVLPESTMQSAATLIQSYLGEIGITAELINLEGPTWQSVCDGEDSTAYDINFYMNATNTYSWTVYKYFSASYWTNGLNNNFIYDQTLEDLYFDAGSVEYGTSAEGVNNLVDYINENVYGYAFYYYEDVFFARDNIASFEVAPSSVILPGTVVFAD